MVTTFYACTLAVWYSLATYTGNNQSEDCLIAQKHLKDDFSQVVTSCVSQNETTLIVDGRVYPETLNYAGNTNEIQK